MKVQENVNHNQEENQPIESDPQVKEMRKLTENNFKTAILNVESMLRDFFFLKYGYQCCQGMWHFPSALTLVVCHHMHPEHAE